MGTALEKRVRKLEQAIGQAPCDNPEHAKLFVDEPDGTISAENQARIKSIRECPKCKDKMLVHFIHWRGEKWDKYAKLWDENPVPPDRIEEYGRAIMNPEARINFGVESKPDVSLISEPEPFQFSIERDPTPAIDIPDWLKDLENNE